VRLEHALCSRRRHVQQVHLPGVHLRSPEWPAIAAEQDLVPLQALRLVRGGHVHVRRGGALDGRTSHGTDQAGQGVPVAFA
jgi:hypothetical protein